MKISVTYIFLSHFSSCFAADLPTSVSQSLWTFAVELYRTAIEEDNNLVFSPFSAHAILTLTYQGMRGANALLLQDSLRIPPGDVIKHKYKSILRKLINSDNDQVYIANTIYVNDTYHVLSTFRQLAKTYYLSDVQAGNFRMKSDIARRINRWVARRTNFKITDVITEKTFEKNIAVLLINVLYMKSRWRHRFNVENTYEERFYTSDLESIHCLMMHQEQLFEIGHSETLKAQILRMRLEDEKYSMIVLLPDSNTGLRDLERRLNGTDLSLVADKMKVKLVRMMLPKFKFETSWELRKSLMKMGLDQIFTRGSDFSRMLIPDSELLISEVLQRVYIDVAEQGIEAAAVTVVEGEDYSGYDEDYTIPVTFKADHPFLFYIVFEPKKVDELRSTTNYVLFMGKLVTPKAVLAPKNPKELKKPNSTLYGPKVRSGHCPLRPLRSLHFLLSLVTTIIISLMSINT